MGSTPICISRMRSSVHYLIFNSLRSCLGLATSMSQESQLKRQGIAASGGVCRGRVHLLDKKHLHVPQHRVSKDQLEAELSRFESAIVQTRKELKAMQDLLDAGLEDHILLSSDQGNLRQFNRYYGHGWATVLMQFVPKLRYAGVPETMINKILVDNPRRFLAFVPR